MDEFTRECLMIRVARRLNSYDVIEALAEVMLQHGIPEHIRSDNGPEFIARKLRKWLPAVGALLHHSYGNRYDAKQEEQLDTTQILADLAAERDRIDQAIAAIESLDSLPARRRGTPKAGTRSLTA